MTTQAQFENAATVNKVFVANITLIHGGYETSIKKLILAASLEHAELYANTQGMPHYDGSDFTEEPGEQYEAHGMNVWFFECGDWAAKLDSVVELADQEAAKVVAESGLVSFL